MFFFLNLPFVIQIQGDQIKVAVATPNPVNPSPMVPKMLPHALGYMPLPIDITQPTRRARRSIPMPSLN
jgi:hypothetical protein